MKGIKGPLFRAGNLFKNKYGGNQEIERIWLTCFACGPLPRSIS
jgi:hypothetical protein